MTDEERKNPTISELLSDGFNTKDQRERNLRILAGEQLGVAEESRVSHRGTPFAPQYKLEATRSTSAPSTSWPSGFAGLAGFMVGAYAAHYSMRHFGYAQAMPQVVQYLIQGAAGTVLGAVAARITNRFDPKDNAS